MSWPNMLRLVTTSRMVMAAKVIASTWARLGESTMKAVMMNRPK